MSDKGLGNPSLDRALGDWDVLIAGGGAAGMAAAIFLLEAARQNSRPLRVAIVEGAKKPGAKILVSGGGRCNVTHQKVGPEDYQGGNSHIIRNVIRSFPVERTLAWFDSLGVDLKLESTGKWFPVTDRARTVLDALLQRLRELGVVWITDCRVQGIEPQSSGGWLVQCSDGTPRKCRRLVVAMGGMALPKSGSDGWGLDVLRRLGHTIRPTAPALAPITTQDNFGQSGFPELSGVSADLRLVFSRPGSGPPRVVCGSTLFTHFGLSGPAPMDISRHISVTQATQGLHGYQLTLGVPDWPSSRESDLWLLERAASHPNRTVQSLFQDKLPERLAHWWADGQGHQRLGTLDRGTRKTLAARLAGIPVNTTGTRGFSFAETTAGGVDLTEVDHRTMASRVLPDLHLVGEILDADGRIGGFNFQWAWATGLIAGRAIAKALSTNSVS